MTGMEPLGYLLVRVFTCGSWFFGGLHKCFHFNETAKEMGRRGIPLPKPMLVLVLAMEFVGCALLFANYYVWAAALAWTIFLIPATIIYHIPFMTLTPRRTIDVMQYRNFWKNLSMMGGLIAVMLLDPTRPDWLFGR